MTKFDLESLSDEELMVSYQESNIAAFDLLFSRWKDRVWSFVAKRLKIAEVREDVVQKIFLKLHSSRASYNAKYLFAQWIFTIAKTVIIDHLRSNKKRQYAEVELKDFTIESIATQNIPDRNLDSITSTLTLEQQQIIKMRFEQDYEFAEIAAVINKSEINIRKILSRAFIKLRNTKYLRGAQ